MASLYAKHGVMCLSWFENGRRITKTLRNPTTNNKLKNNAKDIKLAKRLKKELELKLDIGEEVKLYHLTLQNAIDKFLADSEASEKTKIEYKRILDDAQKCIGNIYVRQYNHNNQLKEYWQFNGKKENSKTTVATYFTTLRILFNYLLKNNYISKNPIPTLKSDPKAPRIISKDDKKIMLEWFKGHNLAQYRLVKLMFLTGFRITEALFLEWGDVDFSNKIINLTNTKAKRKDLFPLYDELYNFLIEWEGEGRLFHWERRDSTYTFWRTMKSNTGLNYSPHDIRRTFASELAENGVPLPEVSALVRHKDINTTNKYYLGIRNQHLIDLLNNS